MTALLQEQLIAARRHQILDAAAKIFAEKGFHPTTIKDIAREADIADGTIYNYFENKSALLLGILDRMAQQARQDADVPAAGDAFDLATLDLRSFITLYLRQPLTVFKADNYELFRVILSEIMVNEKLREGYYRQIVEPTLIMAEAALSAWGAAHGMDSRRLKLTVRAVSSMILGVILYDIIGDPVLHEAWDDLPEFLADLIVDGMGAGLS